MRGEQSEMLNQLKIDREPFEDPRPSIWRWIGLGLLGIALLAGTLRYFRETPPLNVQTTRARIAGAQDASDSVLDASGYVVPRRRATVSSKMTGKVMELLIEEGSKVREGDVLARIDDSNIKAEMALARSQLAAVKAQLTEIQVQLAEARRDLNRIRELSVRKLLSASALDTAQAHVDTLQARLQSAQSNVTVSRRRLEVQDQQLDDTFVRAPFDGVITVKNAQPGEMISPLSAGGDGTRTGIGTLVDMDSLEIEVDVNEKLINRVQAGQEVDSRLNAYPDWKIPSTVIAVVPTADRSKATVKVRIGFETRDPRILPDMGIRVSFLSPPVEHSAGKDGDTAMVLLSKEAVLQQGHASIVFLVRDDVLERRAIKTGHSFGNELQIEAGLQGGETLALGELASFEDGMRVKADQE